MNEIIFTNLSSLELDPPIPAAKMIPDWYKNMPSYYGGKKIVPVEGGTFATVKKCIPVLDAITAGYIITAPVDIYVSQRDGFPWYQWAMGEGIQFHPVVQAPAHPLAIKDTPFPKFTNPWSVMTPKGYSVLFTQPFHREAPFEIMDGIVDTDTYSNTVNFPFQLKDPKFEGYIYKGTPIAQVIPFKRDIWKMKVGTQENLAEALKVRNKILHIFYDKYKNNYWTRKEFK
jgi:hypothetical protein